MTISKFIAEIKSELEMLHEEEFHKLSKSEFKALLDSHEAMRVALDAWAAYDALLRTISGSTLFNGDMPKVDAAYDDCVAKTTAALSSLTSEPGEVE